MHPNALIAHIESVAPLWLSESWDKSGVQIAGLTSAVSTLCVTLDPTIQAVTQAVDAGAEFLLCHHPLALSPRLPNKLDEFHQILTLALGHKLWVYSAHTSLDANPNGPVNWLGQALGLLNMRPLEVTRQQTPVLVRPLGPTNQEALTEFSRIPDSTQPEYLLWPDEKAAFQARLDKNAPCAEMPVPSVQRTFGFGCLGRLPKPLAWAELENQLRSLLGANWRSIGATPDTVSTVAYCPGSGADLGQTAFAQGADIYLTGDVKYHQAQALQNLGLTLDVGHFCLEEAMMRSWSETLEQELAQQGISVIFLPGRDPFY